MIGCRKAEEERKTIAVSEGAEGLPKNQTPWPSCESELSNKNHTCEIHKSIIILKVDK